MDNIVDYKNFEVLKNVLNDTNLRQSIRLLNVFGCGAGEAIVATNDDKVYVFGRNRFGGLGLGTDVEQVPTPTLNQTLSSIQLTNFFCGFEHWLALTASGRCYSWGHNGSGQLGNGTLESSTTPQPIKALDNKQIVDISCGGFYNLALSSDGQVYGWGDNRFGQLGYETTDDSVVIPKQMHFNYNVVSISNGMKHSMVLTVIGRVYVWGLNNFGQLGFKSKNQEEINAPQVIPGFEDTEFTKAVCGPTHSLVLTLEGYVYAFGDNRCGQIGNGSLKPQKRPFKVSDILFKDIVAHKENDVSIAVAMDNTFYVWGLANNRRYMRPNPMISGDSIFDIYAKVVRKSVTFKTIIINDELKSWEQISEDFIQTDNNLNVNKDRKLKETEDSLMKCVSKSSGTVVRSLGLVSKQNNLTVNHFLDLKDFTRYDLLSIDKKVVNSIRLFYVFQRGQSVIYVTEDDKVYALGFNRKGALGLGHKKENLRIPELNTILSGKHLVDIVSGYEHCIALTASGECYSWGSNKYGELGIGSNDYQENPQKIEEFYDKVIVQINCGAYHSMALTSEGELFSWGHNTFAQLGDETYNSRTTPIQVLIKDTIISVSCGGNHSLALTSHGIVYVWGCNETGELGRPRDSDFKGNRLKAMCKNPTKISGLDDVTIQKAICGHKNTYLLSTDGYVFTFGDNSNGQIGNGTFDTQSTPFILNKTIVIKDLITQWNNDLIIVVTNDNSVYAWGLANDQKVVRPKLIPSYGKSLFDIYLKLAKNKVLFKALNTNEDKIGLNNINKNVIKLKNPINFSRINDNLNESSISSNYDSSENLIKLNDCKQIIINNSNNNVINENQLNEIKSAINNSTDQSICDNSVLNNEDLISITGREFLKHLNKSFNNPNKFDLKFVSKDKVIYCHKTILQIRNEMFWNVLRQNLDEVNNEIRINPKTYDSFYAFLQHMYGIEPQINVQFINDLKNMAKYFNETQLENICLNYVQQLIACVEISNVCPFYERAVYFELSDLEKHCIKFISYNRRDIFKSDAFQEMDDSLSKRLMASVLNIENN